MALRPRRTGSGDYGRYIKALVAGEPGAGKTMFGSTWPNVLYLNAEGGMMSVSDRNVLVQDIEDSQTLLEAIVALRQDGPVREKIFGGPVETVVLDTLDEVARLLQRERIVETKKEAMQMQDWGWFGDQLRGIIRGLRNLEMHVILNVHLRTQEDSEAGSLLVKPAIQGQVGDELAGYVDLALLLKSSSTTKMVGEKMVRETVRTIQTFGTSRYPWIKDRSGKLPPEFDVNFEDDYKRLDALIYGGNGVKELDRTPTPSVVEPETPAETAPAEVDEPKAETPVPKRTRSSKKLEEKQPPPGVDPETGEVKAEAAQTLLPDPADAPDAPLKEEEKPKEPSKNKMGLPDDGPPWKCADCGDEFDDPDQAALSMIRFRRRLDGKCFKNARAKK